jgi:hypothetical protein
MVYVYGFTKNILFSIQQISVNVRLSYVSSGIYFYIYCVNYCQFLYQDDHVRIMDFIMTR